MRSRRRLLLLALFLLAGAAVLRLRPRAVPAPVVLRYTPQQAAAAQERLDTLRDQVAPPAHIIGARGPSAGRSVSPIQLNISQADLNTYLATNPRVRALLAAKGVRAVQVILSPPQGATFRAAVIYKGQRANVQVTGTLLPSPRTGLRLHVLGAQVGRLPLPPSVVSAQADKIAAQIVGRAQGRLPMTVEQVQVTNGHIALIGHRRPPQTARRQ